ncbi:hypothetical protein C2S53_007149 [Perilla frutescens var. hirtella]|uniref:Uncharacterized protein n=1 Tax=Perilla frutescens var. hirtella TaxID=608512 RepID=A0AAD4NX68_PERFH|nr:hypothetical protein C2S53_007149 [Perilla frutescens var. hirtella]
MSFIISEQQFSSPSSVTACSQSQVETNSQERDHVQETTATTAEDRPTSRLHLVSRKTRSRPSSPKSANKQSGNLGRVDFLERGVQKTVSCKSLGDLELDEVKGFMDLGFVFKKENLSSHMISLIPGLQRIKAYNSDRDEGEDENKEKRRKMKPYMSEAWLVRRLDSPLITSLRISRVCNDSDQVKKQLKNWARTVAAAIQQESDC